MANFDSTSIIGGTYDNLGCQFDNFETLINSYFSLLFDTLTKDAIVYSTGRNGILAKVELDFSKGGFVNYVQSSIGKWNYSDPKYQRKVSPEFVIYLFNNLNMNKTYNAVNNRNEYFDEPMKFNNYNQAVEGVFIRDLSMAGIIELHEKHMIEYAKKINGQLNKYDQIKPAEVVMVRTLYELIGSVCKLSKKFWEFQNYLERAEELREGVDFGKIEYESLNQEEEELYLDFYPNDDYYLSLGVLNNFIREQAAKELIKKYKQKRSLERQGKILSDITSYDDPIGIVPYGNETNQEYYGDSDFVAVIDYSHAKEFPINSNKIIIGGKQPQIRKLK